MPKRKLEEVATPADSEQMGFEAHISTKTPLADYIKLIRTHVQSEKIIDDEDLKENFSKISAAARNVIWELLFGAAEKEDAQPTDAAATASAAAAATPDSGGQAGEANVANANVDADTTAQRLNKAAELLEEHKCDACFYAPCEYNEWIVTVRDELLKRNMIDFWRDSIVKRELGPCWAKDSDLFDDLDDPAPHAFYAHGGCEAPFSAPTGDHDDDDDDGDYDSDELPEAPQPQETPSTTTTSAPTAPAVIHVNNDITITPITTSTTSNATNEVANNVVSTTTASNVEESQAKYVITEAKISDNSPLGDYQDLMQQYVRAEEITSDEVLGDNFKMISEAARNAIWRFLFEATAPLSEDDLAKVGEILEEHKGDACFYGPWEYNVWIVKVRDELLKRNMLEFWRDYVVKLELGPCWAKDSDYYDDLEDPEPEAFYAFGGCQAPFAGQSLTDDLTSDEEEAGGGGGGGAAAAAASGAAATSSVGDGDGSEAAKSALAEKNASNPKED